MSQLIKSVGIIGYGWLGKALVKELVSNKVTTIATSRSEDKLKDIELAGAMPALFDLPVEQLDSSASSLFSFHNLIICIPPYLKKGQKDYSDKIKELVTLAEKGGVETIILISSTACYEGHIGDVDEFTVPNTRLEKVNLIHEAEKQVLAFSRRGVVLRCAGLVGPDRHPGRFLNHGRVVADPHAYVNLVHQQDVVNLCCKLLESSNVKGVFNCVSQTQVTKQHFYSVAARCLGLDVPQFNENDAANLGRHVIAKRVLDELDYKFVYPDIMTWIVKNKR